MRYSIIVPTLNHLDDCLRPCLESIRRYTDLSDVGDLEGRGVEILVVANGCTDGTREYVESLGAPFRLLWFDEPLGYAGANNRGVEMATGEFIVLLNNDTVLLEQPVNQWLDVLVKPFLDDPFMGVTGPSKQYSPPAGRTFIIFFCAMTTRALYDRLKLSEDYFPGGGEDSEFCFEAEKLGYKVVAVPGDPTYHAGPFIVGNFPIYHRAEATMNDFPNWQQIFDDNSRKLAAKYNGG